MTARAICTTVYVALQLVQGIHDDVSESSLLHFRSKESANMVVQEEIEDEEAEASSMWIEDHATLLETNPSTYAGEYDVYYRGGKRSTGMVIYCDGTVSQPGIFTDRLHFDNVKAKCDQSRDRSAAIYIEKTHGAAKYECLTTGLKGSHYTSKNAYWGTIEYRKKSTFTCDARAYAGEYDVYYRGGKRSTGMVISCDGTASQPGIFTDRLHFDNVKAKCDQSRDNSAAIYIEKTHGAAKYECLTTGLKGSHYTSKNAYWGTIEYKKKKTFHCGDVRAYAGQYDVYYRGGKRSTGMVIKCDGTVSQPGIFTDRLHFDNVKAKCDQSRDRSAAIYIEKTHGAAKYECLTADLKGSHYTSKNAYWGTIEYRKTKTEHCPGD